MEILPGNRIFCSLLLVCAAACFLLPAMAANGTISIAYRGSGGSYVGDTVIFDGRNTYGNTTLITISGPGLPAEGVPVNNLNGPAGTGTPVEVDQEGAWKFAWYASGIPGIEKLKTARYTFTATDLKNPDKFATTTLVLRKPEFSVSASPNPITPGNYIVISGTADGIPFAKIDVSDSSGRVLHTFTSPVSSYGDFSYGFHVDMGPGQYQITVSNPALKAPFGSVISVIPQEGTLPVTTTSMPSAVPTAEVTSGTPTAPAAETSPARTPLAPVTVLVALVAGIVLLGISRR